MVEDVREGEARARATEAVEARRGAVACMFEERGRKRRRGGGVERLKFDSDVGAENLHRPKPWPLPVPVRVG